MKQYDSMVRYWLTISQEEHKDPYNPTVTSILDCLTKKYEEGAVYDALNTLRSFISREEFPRNIKILQGSV